VLTQSFRPPEARLLFDRGTTGENHSDRVETLFTGALASIGLEILSEFFEPGIFGL
jgi:hypothetical protein